MTSITTWVPSGASSPDDACAECASTALATMSLEMQFNSMEPMPAHAATFTDCSASRKCAKHKPSTDSAISTSLPVQLEDALHSALYFPQHIQGTDMFTFASLSKYAIMHVMTVGSILPAVSVSADAFTASALCKRTTTAASSGKNSLDVM